MNQHFNITRFGKLFKKEFSERISTIITISVIFAIIFVIWWIIALLIHMTGTHASSSPNSRAFYLFCALCLTVIFSPLILYYRANHRKKGIDYITLPASFNEKFVSMLIHMLIIFPIAVGVSMITVDLILSTLSPAIFDGSILFSGILAKFEINRYVFYSFWTIFSMFSLFLLCNAIYRRNKTVKSIFSILLFYLMSSIIVGCLTYTLFHQWIDISIINNPSLYDYRYVELKEHIKPFVFTMKMLFVYILPVSAIAGSYFKMKNQQY